MQKTDRRHHNPMTFMITNQVCASISRWSPMTYQNSICSLSLGKLPQRSSLWALSLSLSAVNLSESAQGKMAPTQLTQMYVTAATALRTLLGHHLSFLPVSLLQCPITDPVYLTNTQRRWLVSCIGFTLDEFTVHHRHLFFCVCPAGLSVELCRECGQPIRDKANPWLPALALHPIG